jgi:hypothetical protein
MLALYNPLQRRGFHLSLFPITRVFPLLPSTFSFSPICSTLFLNVKEKKSSLRRVSEMSPVVSSGFFVVLFVLVLLASQPVAAVYNIAEAMAWLKSRGCRNATITNCPGNQLCTDAEFFARALAAGQVIRLDPNSHTQAGYNNYEGYNLCLSNEFESFLTEHLGWSNIYSPQNAVFPEGAIVVTHEWSMPMIADGHGRCSSHTPVVAHGPHCAVECPYFNVAAVYVPPPAPTVTRSV